MVPKCSPRKLIHLPLIADHSTRKDEKNLSVVVEDEDLPELMRILMDDDAEAALAFLKSISREKPVISSKEVEKS